MYALVFNQVIADFLSNKEAEGIRDIVAKIDTDNDGIVSIEDLKAGLLKFNGQMEPSEVQMLIEVVSLLHTTSQ